MCTSAAFFLLFCGFSASADDAARIPIGPDTTFFDGPLDKSGDVDFEAALMIRFRGKITPEQNANVVIMQALGPAPEGGKGLPPRFFEALGMPMPPKNGEYFLQLGRIRGEQPFLDVRIANQLLNDREVAMAKPWKRTDYPGLADWLDSNEKQLALLTRAARRPHYFNPLITSSQQNPREQGLITALMPNVQQMREVERALCTRAMLRLGEGVPSEAWEDLLTAHRLSRLASHGSCPIEHMCARAFERITAATDIAFLQHCRLSSKQLKQRLRDLQQLPPMAPITLAYDLGERAMVLDTLRLIRRGEVDSLNSDFPEKSPPLTAEQKRTLANLDWVSIQKSTNAWYDRLVAAQNAPGHAARLKAHAEFAQATAALKQNDPKFTNLHKFLFDPAPGKTPSQALGDRILYMFFEGTPKWSFVHVYRSPQFVQNLQIAFALEAYRRDHKRFPEKLAALVPDYLTDIPLDYFSDKPQIYRATADDFLLYSIAENGQDDHGNGDDLAIRIRHKPLPADK